MKGVTVAAGKPTMFDATVEMLQGEARQVPEPIEMAYDLHEDVAISHAFLCDVYIPYI